MNTPNHKKTVAICTIILLGMNTSEVLAQRSGHLLDVGPLSIASLSSEQIERRNLSTRIADASRRTTLGSSQYSETLRRQFFHLPSFRGSSILATTRGIATLSDGSIRWTGTIGESDMLQSIVVSDEGASGSLIFEDARIEFRPLGNSTTDVFTIDDEKMPPDHEAGWKPFAGSAVRDSTAGKVLYTGTGLTIKVLVLYSSAGASNIAAEAATAESMAIDAFGNSDLPFSLDVTTQLVTVAAEPDVSRADALDLANGLVVSNVASLRATHTADVVVYVTSHPSPSARGASAAIFAASAEAYAVISKVAFPSLTLAHEIGHLAGALHPVEWMKANVDKNYDPSNSVHNPIGLEYVHGYFDSSENPSFGSMMYVPHALRAPYWSSPDIYYGYEPDESPPVGRPVGSLPYSDVRAMWIGEIGRVTAFVGPAGVLSDTTYLDATISGPAAVEWHHSATFYANVNIVTENGSVACGANCNYFWYERWDENEAFQYTGINAATFYFTMTWWDGHEFMLFSNHKSLDIDATDAHFVDRCIVGCGGGAKGYTLGSPTELAPATVALRSAFPNPFNPSATISFDVPESTILELGIFDTLGRQISVLASGRHEAGTHSAIWNASGHASGTYFAVLRTVGTVETIPVILSK